MDTRLMLQAIEEERSRNAHRLARIAAAKPVSDTADAGRSGFGLVQMRFRWFAQCASAVKHTAKGSRASRAPVADR